MTTISLAEQLLYVIPGLVYVAIIFGYVWVAKKLADITAHLAYNSDLELEGNSNEALAWKRVGLYVGTVIAMLGPLSGPAGKSFWHDVLGMILSGASVTVLLVIAGYVNDKFILYRVDNAAQIAKRNNAVGIVECGSYIATGLIARASFSGEGGGLLSALIFFFLGQVALVSASAIYERILPYKLVALVEKSNDAAGTLFAGMLISLGIILSASITGPFSGWAVDITGFVLFGAIGFGLLLLVKWAVDQLLLPNTTIREEIERDGNTAVGLLTAAVLVSCSLVISQTIM